MSWLAMDADESSPTLPLVVALFEQSSQTERLDLFVDPLSQSLAMGKHSFAPILCINWHIHLIQIVTTLRSSTAV